MTDLTFPTPDEWARIIESFEAVGAIFKEAARRIVALLEELAATREASREHGRTWQDMLGKPQAARAMMTTEPTVWRWHWSPKYGRR